MTFAPFEPFTFNGKTLPLKTRAPLLLLNLLRSQPRRIWERDTLHNALGLGEDASYRAVDKHVKVLRRELGKVWPRVRFIETHYKIGYKWAGPQVAAQEPPKGPGLAWQRRAA